MVTEKQIRKMIWKYIVILLNIITFIRKERKITIRPSKIWFRDAIEASDLVTRRVCSNAYFMVNPEFFSEDP